MTRKFLIPFAAIYLILSKIMGMSAETTGLRMIETIITMIFVSILYKIVDVLLFSENNILTGKEVLPRLARDVIHLIIIIIFFAFVLSDIWGFDLGNMLTALGVSSIVLGLALQEPLGNLFNGMSLLLATPFQKGDWVDIEGNIGKAVEINWRSVKIQTRFNEEIIIPNNTIAKANIKNLSRPNKKYVEVLQLGFSYDDEPNKVKKILFDIATRNEKILNKPAPIIYTLSYDDFAITYGIKFYVKDYADLLLIKDELITEVYTLADEHDLTIPFPRQEIELRVNSSS